MSISACALRQKSAKTEVSRGRAAERKLSARLIGLSGRLVRQLLDRMHGLALSLSLVLSPFLVLGRTKLPQSHLHIDPALRRSAADLSGSDSATSGELIDFDTVPLKRCQRNRWKARSFL